LTGLKAFLAKGGYILQSRGEDGAFKSA